MTAAQSAGIVMTVEDSHKIQDPAALGSIYCQNRLIAEEREKERVMGKLYYIF